MYIQSLSVKNYRNLRSFKIDFNEKLTVLVANNGAGKTAVLDAITIALGTFIGGFPAGRNKGFTQDDVMINFEPHRKYQERQFPTSLTAIINNNVISRSLNTNKSNTTNIDASYLKIYASELLNKLRTGSDVELPIISYYGTSRLWDGLVRATKKYDKESKSRAYAYHDCLFPESNYKEFKKWFIDLTIQQYNNILNSAALQIKTNGIIEYDPLLLEVQKSVNIALSSIGWGRFHYDIREKLLLIENSKTGVKLPVEYLSGGVKNMLSVVADLSYRCCKLNPQFTHPCVETYGIVLIDEVDMHLHPSWQQNVIISLQNIFPRVQFIVSTHSPQVLSTIKRENIRIINPENEEAEHPIINPYGRESVVSLEDIMNVKSRPIGVVDEAKQMDEYLQLVHNGNYDSEEVKNLRNKLDNVYGSKYDKLQLADMIINMWKAKKR